MIPAAERLRRATWLKLEMGLRWNRVSKKFVSTEDHKLYVPLDLVDVTVSFGTFQRAARKQIDRLRKKLGEFSA